jgi:putative ABC transport system substrate-binding protein
MKRREFMASVAAAAAAWPLPAIAQKTPHLVMLLPLPENDPEQVARREGMRVAFERLGWEAGRNLRIDYRYAAGDTGRFAAFAKEAVALRPDVIFVQSTGFAQAVQQETRTIPVVFTNVSDPVGSGLVASLARPGGNFTGLTLFDQGIVGKWFGMLKEMSPRLKHTALIINPKNTAFDYFFGPTRTVAQSLAIEIVASHVENPAEIERAIESIAATPDGGFVIAPGSTMLSSRKLIIALAARHRLPAVYPERVYATDGGLMSYGIADLIEPFRQAASYIDGILRGEKPADLPVQGPTKYATVVNARTASALGLTVPPGLLVAADEVID